MFRLFATTFRTYMQTHTYWDRFSVSDKVRPEELLRTTPSTTYDRQTFLLAFDRLTSPLQSGLDGIKMPNFATKRDKHTHTRL